MALSQGYRVFVGAFPEGPLIERLQQVRAQYDPQTAAITAPHVTLAGTYRRAGPATAQNEAATLATLRALQGQLHPFDLQMGGIASFLPHSRVIYLQIVPDAGLLAAREVLLAGLGMDRHKQFVPHLTLTMRLGKGETAALLEQLQASEWHARRWSFRVEHLWLMLRGPQDPAWRALQRIDMLASR